MARRKLLFQVSLLGFQGHLPGCCGKQCWTDPTELFYWIYIASFIYFQGTWELPQFGTWAELDVMWPSWKSWTIGSSLSVAFITQGEQSCRQGKVSKFLRSIALRAVIFIAEILSQVPLSGLQTVTFGDLTMWNNCRLQWLYCHSLEDSK